MRNSRLISVVLLVSLLSPMFIAPAIYIPTSSSPVGLSEPVTGPSFFKEPMAVTIPPDAIRVAIYNEPNTTSPSYEGGIGSINTNSSSQIASILQAAGYQTTLLDTNDIYNHQLMTAHYDVFVIPDTLPRENITNQIYEYWLGGGALLGFDSFAVYSCFMGILPPETAGTNGYPGYWSYMGNYANVSTRHPVSKSYAVYDTFTLPPYSYAAWDWTALSASAIGSDLTRVAHDGLDEDEVTVLAFDPTTQGGRVVHFWWDGSTAPLPGIHQMVQDAVLWLCPRPKGRVLFDLSHQPYYGVDSWDDLANFGGEYEVWRDALVARGYLFDKLYPAAGGNITLSRLSPYDMFIACLPQYNYTAAEVTAMNDWVMAGGGLLTMGDNSGLADENNNLNYLLSNVGLSMSTVDTTSGSQTYFVKHPTTEAVSSLYFASPGLLNYTGSAYPIWGVDATNIMIGGQSHNMGRVILVCDINWVADTNIGTDNNHQYSINLANWLTSSLARVLIYTDEVFNPNYYKSPVALALNDLGVKFYLTGGFVTPRFEYFNHSLYRYTWDLVIVDNANYNGLVTYYDDLVHYLDAGGSVIFTSYTAQSGAGHPLFSRFGVTHAASVAGDPTTYIWDAAHHIFTMPHHFTISNFNTTFTYSDDGDRFTVLSNATALAGGTQTPTADEAYIIASNNGKTLLNGYLIDNFGLDEDDSTYEDRFELWINEIAYMMAPRCTLLPLVPMNGTLGFPVTFAVEIENLGLTAAVEGQITVTVPPGFGSLTGPATQPFFVLPGQIEVINWEVFVEGVGNFTLSFDADYYGLPGTMYSTPTATADIEGIPSPFTPPPIPGLPWWWWIAVLAVVIIVVVIIIIYLVMKRRGTNK
ncbi:MAG: hypothetical protein ACFFDU_00870 [Candidatus Thorarchaeota archaeon]